MNNKHLSWNEEINNNFIIASREYFLQCKPAATSHSMHNPKMKEVVRTEILKLLEASIIYPIADSSEGNMP